MSANYAKLLIILGLVFCGAVGNGLSAAAQMAQHAFDDEALQSQSIEVLSLTGWGEIEPQSGQFVLGEAIWPGWQIDLGPGSGGLLLGPAIENAEGPVALVVEYAVLQGDPNVAVIVHHAPDAQMDGQFAFTQRRQGHQAEPQQVKRLAALFEPPSGVVKPAVQLALAEGAPETARVAIFSLSAYSLDAFLDGDLATEPNGDFETEPENLRTNINQDAGQVTHDAGRGALSLELDDPSQAANFALNLTEEAATESLLGFRVQGGFEPAESSRAHENGQVIALLHGASWSSGVAVNAGWLAQSGMPLIGGGSGYDNADDLEMIVQYNGGAPGQPLWVDDVEVLSAQPGDVVQLPDLPDAASGQRELLATLLMPETLFAGGEGSFSVTLLDDETRQPVSAPYRVVMRNEDQSTVLGAGQVNAQGIATHSFPVEAASGEWQVQVGSGEQQLAQGQVRVERNAVLLIETDKPIYRPGQRIQGRVLTLNNAMAPISEPVEVEILDAKGIRVYRETLTANAFGVAPFELPLASELNHGAWKIRATAAGASTEVDVEVDQYVLPAFAVDLRLEKEWLLVDEDPIRGVVESGYFFGEPVQGEVEIEALHYVGEWQTFATQRGRLENGRFAFELPAAPYGAGTAGNQGDAHVHLKVSVTDDTGVTESTDQLVPLVEAGVRLQLLPDAEVIKPGLQQEMLLVSETPGHVPLSMDVDVEIAFVDQEGNELVNHTQVVTTQNGTGRLAFDVPEGTALGIFTATARRDGRVEEESTYLNAAYSPGGHFIHLRQAEAGMVRVGQEARFTVWSTSPGTVFYDVVGSGRTLFSGTTQSGQIQFTVTPAMSGQARLVAYQIQPNNEVAVDVLPFAVERAAPVDLQAQFSAEVVRPGEPVALSLQSAAPSMVGLSIVDESIFALVEGRMNLQNVFAELERIYMEPQIEVHEPELPWMEPLPPLGGQGARDVLRNHQLQVIASAGLQVPEGEEVDPWALAGNPLWRGGGLPVLPVLELEDTTTGGAEPFQEPQRVRSFFPETWLWEPALQTDDAGSARLELTAPDSITTWKLQAVSTAPDGLGMANAELRVFQDFFVEPELPYAVIRGDRFPLRARLFNYLDEPQSIRVTLGENPSLGIDEAAEQTVEVPANSATSVEFILQPTDVGMLPVDLVAQSASRADAVRRDLRVEPEGAPREIIHNGILNDATSVTVDLSLPAPVRPLEPTPEALLPPVEVVPDSQRYRVSVTGSLMGQTLAGIDDLLGMPFGCGEQNMILLAPNIEVLRYLQSTNQLQPEIRAKAEFYITTGYQRQLTFQRTDGSFSAFGQQDESGSLWLTAFVLGAFSRARAVQSIDEAVLADAAEWIVDHQQRAGHWEPVGFVVHEEMTGGLNSNLVLTAFVLNALLDYGHVDEAVLEAGFAYLTEHRNDTRVDAYALSQVAYALVRGGHPEAGDAVDRLTAAAQRDANGLYWQPHAIEATGYAALALLAEAREEAQDAIAWLASQRNGLGGFNSTQDTVVALQAMTQAAIEQTRDLNATISVAVDGEVRHTFAVNQANFDVLQLLEIDAAESITLRQEGNGRVLYQVVHAFHVPVAETPQPASDLVLDVTYNADAIQVDDQIEVSVSVLYLGIHEETGMTIVDVAVPTGFEPVAETLDRLRAHDLVKRIETAGRKVILYIDHLVAGEPLDLHFAMRALYPVDVDAGVSQAYLYYDPQQRDESSMGALRVE